MYCPKCKRKYTDGSLRCRECNEKLVVRLPMEKVKKKKEIQHHNSRLKNNKRDIIGELFLKMIFSNKPLHIYILGFLIGGLVIYFGAMELAFEKMDLKDALLVVKILEKFKFILLTIVPLILFVYGIEEWRCYEKLKMKNKTAAVIMKGMLILFIVTAEINMLSKPVLDFIYKDHYISKGTVTSIYKERRYGRITIYVDHKGYSYTKRLRRVTIGKTYTFTYSRRSHLILDIK
ncbi:hypothetical protein [Clostridium ganghwense]|uniref:Zinc ribbon domain-containing protein n=1 Tax=Clostridium ganghwense TaxID=312089 RepID=A0ABT4CJY5_9CLOT|nr:hypothetical protein [Clostridium ganghwense]MCY6369360.1 hypothetical protein [Clostridium ganghwense]